MASSARFIAAVGLPCVGKSTVFEKLAPLLGAVPLLEPEESAWPSAVTDRDRVGYFTGLAWFRSVRVPLYYEALELRANGSTALLDSYYDKLCSYWLGKPGMEWLIGPDDPYFIPAREVALLDRALLPLADTLVVFTVARDAWEAFIAARGRRLDQESGLREKFFTQEYFVEGAEALAEESGIPLIRFHQDRIDTPAAAAKRLLAKLS